MSLKLFDFFSPYKYLYYLIKLLFYGESKLNTTTKKYKKYKNYSNYYNKKKKEKNKDKTWQNK
jgi:hypothetical protein